VHLVGDRSVLLLAVSYMCMNYTFYLLSNWVFLYLVQERKFSLLESGWLAAAPPLAAAIGAGIGRRRHRSLLQAFRRALGISIGTAGGDAAGGRLLLLAVNATNPYLAVVALCHLFRVRRTDRGRILGRRHDGGPWRHDGRLRLMNTGGNLGGIISIPIVAYFSGQHLWFTAFFIGTGFASSVQWRGWGLTLRRRKTPAPSRRVRVPVRPGLLGDSFWEICFENCRRHRCGARRGPCGGRSARGIRLPGRTPGHSTGGRAGRAIA